MVIEKNRVVSIDYKLTDDDGDILDSSEGSDPLEYLHGNGNIIPGLEKHLDGKKAGDAVKCVIPPAEAYGEKDDSLIMSLDKNQFDGTDIELGAQFQGQIGDEMRVVTVIALDDDKVTVDANHPLAGETLHFDVKVVGVREASEEELAHGHVHGAHEHGCGDDCDCEGGCGDGEEGSCGCGGGCCGD
jgi:FKBP-type peptidyl-prolyl cis-trans isomerase SlyD